MFAGSEPKMSRSLRKCHIFFSCSCSSPNTFWDTKKKKKGIILICMHKFSRLSTSLVLDWFTLYFSSACLHPSHSKTTYTSRISLAHCFSLPKTHKEAAGINEPLMVINSTVMHSRQLTPDCLSYSTHVHSQFSLWRVTLRVRFSGLNSFMAVGLEKERKPNINW